MFERVKRWLDNTAAEAPVPPTPPCVLESDAREIDHAFSSGVAAYKNGAYDEAMRNFMKVVSARHDDADAQNWLGLAHFKRRDLEDACDCFMLATHFRPNFADAWYHLALVAQRRNDHREAVSCLKRAIAACADHAQAYNALGASALELGEVSHAVECFQQAITLRPDHAHAHSNLGYVLFRDCGEFERGAAHLKIALELNGSDPDIRCNQTMVLIHEGRLEEAISVCDEVLATQPDLDEARLNRSLALLRLGRFDQAWPDYEARKKVRSNYIRRPFDFPDWRGEALAGKTILVHAEQGIGDEIMFASCLPDLLASGVSCALECSARLAPLFRRSFAGVTVHEGEQAAMHASWTAQAGHFDYQVAIGSLPGFFRRHMADFPRHGGYLRADQARIAHWRTRLDTLGDGLKVGISWRGGVTSTRRELRSTMLAAWLPLLRQPECHFVSLQYGDIGTELAALAREHGVNVHHWQPAIDDIDETAALASGLDLVISVQTALVHVSGALGRPTWALVSAVPEWRYMQEGTTMPWYPAVRLFRQQQAGDWGSVMGEVAVGLQRLTAAS